MTAHDQMETFFTTLRGASIDDLEAFARTQGEADWDDNCEAWHAWFQADYHESLLPIYFKRLWRVRAILEAKGLIWLGYRDLWNALRNPVGGILCDGLCTPEHTAVFMGAWLKHYPDTTKRNETRV